MRRTLLAILVLVGVLAGPQVASAAGTIPFADCGLQDGFQCARFAVPVDWSNPAGAKLSLYVERKPAATQPASSALIALAGGPGQSATPFAEAFSQVLASALGSRDLIVYDQRGTGRSGYLTCPKAEQSATSNNDFTAQCATELGPTRSDYSTRDTVDDIEAIRQALGVDKVSIFGVSYGTYVAQLYAKRYPTHTESLILDSVVPPTGVDPFDRTSYRAINTELQTLCAAGRCKGITSSALADATKVAQLAANGGVAFTLVDPTTGRPVALRMGAALFFELFEEGLAFDEVSRARLPAALVSALQGDPFPLGQIMSSLVGPTVPDDDPTSMSDALNLATFCTDTTFPWAAEDSLTTREQKVTTALQALPANSFLPFPRSALFSAGNFNACLAWPSTVPVTVPGPEPDVPVLILSGRDDVLTPYEDALTVAKQFPHAAIVRVPNTGHSVSTTAPGASATCVSNAFANFFAGLPVADCAPLPPNVPPTKVDPTSLAALRPTGAKGLAGRTTTAALDTVRDSLLTLFSRESLTGLRGGLLHGTTSDYTLDHVVFVPGVVVSGSVDWESGVAQLQLTGKGAKGTLRIERGVGVTGKLGGVRIHAGAASANVGGQLVAARMAPMAFSLGALGIAAPSLLP
jgi:pimeloyl-ACP methyl ester carboxylesterase